MSRIIVMQLMFALLLLTNCISKSKDKPSLYKSKLDSLTKVLVEMPASLPGIDSSRYRFIGSPNFNLRKPQYVIIHHTAQESCQQTIDKFQYPESLVSAHYVICKDGTVCQMLNDYLRAWHAGSSKWDGDNDINSISLGVELDNNGVEEFTDAQIQSLLSLLALLKNKYNIPARNFIGHGDITPRKQDPSKYFPWKKLALNGFGTWYDDSLKVENKVLDTKIALRLIGYDVSDLQLAIFAFKRHFIPGSVDSVLTAPDKLILINLAEKTLRN